MWQPTHVQVTVQKAKSLLYKGKHETNDAFVVIALGKDKFQTSIKEKATSAVEWHEECELAIPSHGNTASLNLTVYHRNALGLDEFLGQVQLPLSEFDVYERPRNRWHRLKGKPEKDRKKGEKERGELEVKVAFIVKSGSLLDVSNKKEKNKSITSLKNLGGSLMSLGSKEKANLKSFAKSVSHKIDKIAQKPGKKKSRKESRDGQGFPQELMRSRQHAGDADPGVISDSDDDFGFDEEVTVNTRSSSPYSTVSRGSSFLQEVHEDDGVHLNGNNHILSESRPPPKPARLGVVGSMENVNRSDSQSSLSTSLSSSTLDVTRTDEHGSRFPEIKALRLEKKSREEGDEGDGKKRRGKGGGLKSKLFGGSSRERIGEEDGRIVEGGNDRLPHPPTHQSRLPQEIHDKFAGKSREDLMEMIVNLQSAMEKNARHTRDLEDYIDGLLLRVMESTPQILQAPITMNKKIKVFGPH
ncbi:uncharacterized protein Rip11 isoform X4 [Panulirus ornatus]|uniref:uncharacterized protein Rip11 isoform X4 n=1 Tax=Panulirus ornatus TaxID=150431 RepID=UPI003A88AF99